MKIIPRKLTATCAAMFLSAGLYAGNAADGVEVQGAYVRAVPPGQSNSVAFMSLYNRTGADHILVAAESAASKVVELHTHLKEEGMMKMRRVDRIALPSGDAVKLEPGELHLMLIDLTQDLSPGEDVEITLVYEGGSRATLTAPVKTVQETMEQHQR